jgi:sugar phosphate isomerase/epimerase
MIGVSSTSFSAQNIEDTLREVSKEFELWEIFSEGEHYLPHVIKRFAAAAPSYSMKYSIHAPVSDLNIAALSERLREASTLELMATMEQAIELGVTMVTIHPGTYSMVVPGQELKSIEKAKRSLRTLDRVTAEFGIKMAVENMPSFRFFLGQKAEELKALVDGTDMRICFDIGHANTMGEIDSIIDTLGDRIANIHIHDNTGDKDEHMTVGDGNIDFTKLKRLSKYKGDHIIESRGLESAVESKKRISKIFNG